MTPDMAPAERLARQVWGDAAYAAWRDDQDAHRAQAAAATDHLGAAAARHRAAASRDDAVAALATVVGWVVGVAAAAAAGAGLVWLAAWAVGGGW